MAPKLLTEASDCRIGHGSVERLNDPPDSRSGSEMCVQMDAQSLPSTSEPAIAQTHEVLTFQDSAASNIGSSVGPPAMMTLADKTQDHSLDDFFARPVRIADFTWLEADAMGTTRQFSPWHLYFTNPRVQYKLHNHGFIQCTLKLKILVNASPFYYGSMLAAYRPLTSFTADTISVDPGLRHFIPYSQRPSVWLAPQRNEGAEMSLPFLNPANWLDAGSASDMIDMGQLTFINYTDLQSANGATGTGVTISVYAWAENVHLSGPSLSLATQGDVLDLCVQADEYGRGPVSQVASAIGTTARSLERVPFIGRFATATRIGASAVSKIASMFGYTNVPVIEDTRPLRPEAFPKFSSSDIGFPVEKLTLDPKNELTLDNTVCGAGTDDELAISKLIQRESYLCATTWSTSQPSNTILFSSPVSPGDMYDLTVSAYPKYYFTPLAWVQALFQNWRGDMIFRFRIVASKYHKGRLRVSFDPAGQFAQNLVNTAASDNVVFTEIVDLDAEAEVEFRVPYQQALPFLLGKRLNVTPGWDTTSTPLFNRNKNLDNGTITLRVLTALTAPIALSSVQVQVFVRGAENLEFANPCSVRKGFSNWAVQSDTITTSSTPATLGKDSHVDDNQYLVNFGEKILSLRQVMRRMTLVGVTTPPVTTGQDFYLVQKYFSRIPPYYGYDPNGIHTAKGVVTPANTYKFNFTFMNTMNWVMPAFIGYRGSTNWSFNVDSSAPVSHVRSVRINQNAVPNTPLAIDAFVASSTTGTASQNTKFFYNSVDSGGGGSALTSQRTNAGLNVQCPMYSRFKFMSTSPTRSTDYNLADGNLDAFVTEVLLNNTAVGPKSGDTRIWSYVGIGTDFNVLYFLNVPTYTDIGTSMVAV